MLIRQALLRAGMEENPKQKYRLKIRREKGKPRRQALMAECKMMRPNMWKLQQNQHHLLQLQKGLQVLEEQENIEQQLEE
ncbi:hypothetical protein NEIFLAOT_01104 [Neisseria flavescens NRL30031/H210]|uniref:Uncharacterized protein n=1 Tax=Neisseria flavescens NRL30031/H210 TaxID=546264 RepID=C0EMD3_NEIFL|nr:hypothetical protein NEIFLAOT_01104 [Neisseria flavescens NRL30031/H210]